MITGFSNTKRRRVDDKKDNGVSVPWVEKYRPRKLDDVAAQEHATAVLKRALGSANLPHMLFYGPPGTGKTSTVLSLARELFGPELTKSRVLELNASDERGISMVRDKIKSFARLTVSNPTANDLEQYPCPPYKIIILDEADSMTADAQSALRRTMETYSNVTRFCLICNYVTRIIDPLASRCAKFRFKPLDSGEALARLEHIANEEKVRHEDGVLENILQVSNGDLRRAITLLQSLSKLNNALAAEKSPSDGANELGVATQKQVQEIAGLVPDYLLKSITEKVSRGNVDELIAYCGQFVQYGYSAQSLLEQLHEYYIIKSEEGTAFKNKAATIFFETDARLTNGTNEHIQLLNLLVQLSQVSS